MESLKIIGGAFLFLVALLGVFVTLKSSKRLQKFGLELEMGAVIYGGVVAVYSILLAFIVVIVWGQYSTTGDRVLLEASKIFNVYRTSVPFPDSVGGPIRKNIAEYIKSLHENEWPAMEGDSLSTVTKRRYGQLWKSVYSVHPQDDYEKIWYQSMVEAINQFGDARLLRISDIQTSIPNLMWDLLIFGGVITLLFASLLKGGDDRIHFLKIFLFALLIVFNWVLIYMLDRPYKGVLKVEPTCFDAILKEYKMDKFK